MGSINTLLQALLVPQQSQTQSGAGPLSMLNPTIDPTTGTPVNSQAAPTTMNLEQLLVAPAQQIAAAPNTGTNANTLAYSSPLASSATTLTPQSTVSQNGLII